MHRLLNPLKIAVLVAATLCCMSSAAAAATTTTTDPGTLMQPGWYIHSATVACPGAPQRTLTSVQAATFLQSWLPDALYTTLKIQDPPAGITRCTLTMPWTITGQPPQTPAQIGYASNGTRAWIHLPPGKWSVVRQTQRVVNSFLGHGTYIPVATPPATARPTTTAAPRPQTTRGSSNAWVWFVVGAVVVMVTVLVAMRSRSRSRSRGSGGAAPRKSSPTPSRR